MVNLLLNDVAVIVAVSNAYFVSLRSYALQQAVIANAK